MPTIDTQAVVTKQSVSHRLHTDVLVTTEIISIGKPCADFRAFKPTTTTRPHQDNTRILRCAVLRLAPTDRQMLFIHACLSDAPLSAHPSYLTQLEGRTGPRPSEAVSNFPRAAVTQTEERIQPP